MINLVTAKIILKSFCLFAKKILMFAGYVMCSVILPICGEQNQFIMSMVD